MIEHFLWGLIFLALTIFNFEINRMIHRKTLEEKESFAHSWNQIELKEVEALGNENETAKDKP